MTTMEEDFTMQYEDNDEAVAAEKLKDAEEALGYCMSFMRATAHYQHKILHD